MRDTLEPRTDAHLGTPAKRPKDVTTVGRLLSMREGARYLGVSYWLVRDWVLDGVVRPVRLPGSRIRKRTGSNGSAWKVVAHSTERDTRKVYLDRADLDRLIEERKQ